MIFVAIIPGYIWATLLLAGWAALAYLASNRLSIRHRSMTGMLVVMALQALSGTSVAIATNLDQIGAFACLVGAYGALVSLVLSLMQTAAIVFLSTIWPRSSVGGRHWFAVWVSMWLVFSLAAFLTHARSAALCTV